MADKESFAIFSEVLSGRSSGSDRADDGFVGEMDQKGNVRIVPLKETKSRVDFDTFKLKALKY